VFKVIDFWVGKSWHDRSQLLLHEFVLGQKLGVVLIYVRNFSGVCLNVCFQICVFVGQNGISYKRFFVVEIDIC
jgi:hypothetical protein